MRRVLLCTLSLFVLFAGEIFSQNRIQSNSKIAGAPPDVKIDNSSIAPSGFVSPKRVSVSQYSTTVYTFSDVTVFSYFDDTEVQITNSSGTVVGSATLKADTLYSLSTGSGIYSISGNKPYSVLIGDAITNYVNGYFALDQSGRGKSTKLNTWMMTGSGFDPHFIIFAYEDGTQYTIKELETGTFVYAGTLNDGQYLDFPNISSILGKALQVVSNKPVSALSYTDQDYYVPSANGTFAGNLFYGFSGYAGSWTNSITVTSYSSNNNIVITNLATGATIASYTLGMWQVRTLPITTDTFWKIQSTGRITAANIPFAGWTGSYAYMARSADSTGLNLGTAFVVPTIASQMSVFSYEDNNRVKITLLGDTTYPYTSTTLVADTLLQTGNSYIFSSPYGNKVYRIASQKNVSVLQSNSSAGADFMPLGYVVDMPDLSVSQADINFSTPDSVYVTGDQITITVTVHNYGTIAATNFNVVAYDGDPDAGFAPQIGSATVSSITPGGSYSFSFKYIIPVNAQYHYIYVKADPSNAVVESNESNNKASRPLKPNTDLLPPLAVTVTAPNALQIDSVSKLLTPNPFPIVANVFNTGNVTATNVHVSIILRNGLIKSSGPVDTTIGNISAASSAEVKWMVIANKDSSGLNFYTIHVTAGNADPKDVNRAVNVPDIIAPNAPINLTASAFSTPGSIQLNWTANTEKDLGGYKLYYGLSSTNLNGTEANEGTSPITISQFTNFIITGLQLDKTYYFAIKAFDLSGNLSGNSNIASATTNGQSGCNSFVIVKIKDVPVDQGGQVRVQWRAHCLDFPNTTTPITEYSIWRKVDPKFFTTQVTVASTPVGNWEQVGLVKAVQDSIYFAVVPTYYDSTKTSGMKYTVLFVRAHTGDPLTHFETKPDSGYSVDNLAPAAPLSLSAAIKNNFVELNWQASTEPDLQYYSVYRSESPNININVVSAYKQVALNKFIDSAAAKGKKYYYRISATDFSGNKSTSSTEVSVTTTDLLNDLTEIPKEFGLAQNYPNPFNPATIIRYAVPKTSFVTIELYNILGDKTITLVAAEKKAGVHEVTFDASNLPSGIYFYRMIAENYIATKKMILIK